MALPISQETYNAIQKLEPPVRDAFMKMLQEMERLITKAVASELAQVLARMPTKQEHDELKDAVKSLVVKVAELAEAQKQTEKEINHLTVRVNELTTRVDDLALKVAELAEAQKQTQNELKELAEAQKQTEKELKELIKEHAKTREQLGSLTHTVGYSLEDRAIRNLPQILKNDHHIVIQGKLRRQFLKVSPQRYLEVNIFGIGEKDGKELIIVGEAKTQLKIRDINKLIQTAEKVKQMLGKDTFLVVVSHYVTPEVGSYAKERGVCVYESYEFPFA